MNGSAYIDQQIDARRQMQSVFATAQVGYRESLILDLTARNDWSSTLAYTPHEGSGFFYPSIGAAWIMDKMLPMPEWVSFSKIRAVWSKVLRLHEELPVFVYGPSGFSSSYAMKLKEGGAFGDIYGKAFRRDENGQILYETEGEKKGLPQVEGEGNLIKVGNSNSKRS